MCWSSACTEHGEAAALYASNANTMQGFQLQGLKAELQSLMSSQNPQITTYS